MCIKLYGEHCHRLFWNIDHLHEVDFYALTELFCKDFVRVWFKHILFMTEHKGFDINPLHVRRL